ncbi:MAG: hypothetical protein CME29_07050 [Gemmatimonadetes bacterium]|nr:hypothetical protein [Gemmatimonadota bacterium]
MKKHQTCLLVAIALIANGCASTGGGTSSSRTNPNEITEEELAQGIYSQMSVMEAIGALRPNWIRTTSRPSTFNQSVPSVYADNQHHPLIYLETRRANEIGAVRRIFAGDATLRFGSSKPPGGDVIEIVEFNLARNRVGSVRAPLGPGECRKKIIKGTSGGTMAGFAVARILGASDGGRRDGSRPSDLLPTLTGTVLGFFSGIASCYR